MALEAELQRPGDELPEEIREDWAAFMQAAQAGVWSRPGLSPRNRSLATVAALTALHMPAELSEHARLALQNGLSRRQLCEIVMHVTGYAGVPACVEGLRVLRRLFDAAPELNPPEQRDMSGPVLQDPPADLYERGLAARRLMQPNRHFPHPVVDVFDAGWSRWNDATLFGGLWARPALSLRERSRVTMAVLMALHRPELAIHLRIASNLGIPRDEVLEQIMHLAIYAGFPAAVEALRLARQSVDEPV